MKRIGNIYDKISDLENCIQAVKNATKFKRKSTRVGSFVFTVATNPEYYGYLVHTLLINHDFKPSQPDHFIIKEGLGQKHREIYAPKLFPDQIIHWAIIQVIAPFLSKSFYYYSCGSIPGKGPELIRKYLTRELSIDIDRHKPVRTMYKYCLKLDIRKYFQNINRDIMVTMINDKIKDPFVLNILNDIIYCEGMGTGLPIGYYTSQWLSNIYLNTFDHWVKAELSKTFEKSIYIRYVDDMVIIASNKRKLKHIREQISIYLEEKLKLSLKYDSDDQIFNIGKRDIDFVGFRFTYGKTTVRNRVFRNAIVAEKELNKGRYTENGLSAVISYNGWINKSNCYKEKTRLYNFSDKFYKSKLRDVRGSYTIRKRLNKQRRIAILKKNIHDKNSADYKNGYVSLLLVDKTNANPSIIKSSSIKI